jgi:RNA polymerase sigma-B factor
MQDVLGRADEGFGDVENSVFVEAGLAALDERERRIVELRFFDGLTQSEIAARVGVTVDLGGRRLRKTQHTMRGRLEEEVGA